MLQLVTNNKVRIYNPLTLDMYFQRLALASAKLGVRASEDIFSAQNVLLVAKGDLITPQTAQLHSNKTVLKPIEYSVLLDTELDEIELEKNLLAVVHQDDFLVALNEHQDLPKLIKPFISGVDQYPCLKQKLSVMAIAMPEFYVRTLYCAWFGVLLAKEMHFSELQCQEIFLAALAHDIGMLHIDAFVLERKGELSAEDWKHIQGHVLISQTLMRSMSMPADVVQAVYEHHERCDGTGYPHGKVESELSFAGKILGLADSLIAIYHNRFKHQHKTWRNVIPVIQMNAQAYFYRHEEILATIWRRSEMPFKNVVQGDALPEFVASLSQENKRLNNWFEILRDSLLSLGFTHGDRQLHSLQNVMLHVTTSVKGSGIFENDVTEWLSGIDISQDADAYRKLEKAQVQQQEMIFHLQRLNRMMQIYVESGDCKKQATLNTLIKALEKTKAFMM